MSKSEWDLMIKNIGQLLTLEGPMASRRGEYSSYLGIVENACLVGSHGIVIDWGSYDDVMSRTSPTDDALVIDARGCLVTPGFVDAHTHLVFAGWRAGEYAMRCKGASYLEIAAKGGGINNTVCATRRATFSELLSRTLGFLDTMLSLGTTSVEAKSGYGLNVEDELKQLEVIDEAALRHPMDLVPTFLGAHSVPVEYSGKREEYVEQVKGLLPVIKELGLARFVDVFCDAGAFTLGESRGILTKARDLGFGLKVHADELEYTGATELGCELGAVSCDHLLRVSNDGVEALAESSTVAVLLPATSCFLGKRPWAPARDLIDRGAAVALATDFNPGTSTAMSMPLVMTLACSMMRMSPEEALVASTWNSAWASGLGGKAGGLMRGMWFDCLLFDAEDYTEIPYRFGHDLVRRVVKKGRVFAVDDRRVDSEEHNGR